MAKVVLKLEDDVSTDVIYPGRYMATVLPSETPKYAFADNAAFNEKLNQGKIPAGSILVAGLNFGCGSSREQAASCLQGHGLIVLAKSFSRIFMQNAVNVGLRVAVVSELEAKEGDELELAPNRVTNRTSSRDFAIQVLPKAYREIMEGGGLIAHARKKLLERTHRTS